METSNLSACTKRRTVTNRGGASEKRPTKSKGFEKLHKRKKSTKTENTQGKGSSVRTVKTVKRSKTVGDYDREKPISKHQKASYIQFLHETFDTGVQAILDQYNTHLKYYMAPNNNRYAFDANPDKNRYKDVVCLDNGRVELKDSHPNGNYIHANFFRGEPLLNTFILTQGPMPTTVIDFWRLIVQEKVENIFMLCEVFEQKRSKCEQYWPREMGQTMDFGGILVKNIEVDTSDTTTVLCELEVNWRGDQFRLKHHQWRTWPDKAVPHSVMAPFRLLKMARWSKRPTVVHCSAGIGRTGTVVVLELCLQSILTCSNRSVIDMVKRARETRMFAVQTDLQLLYICKCLVAYATSAKLIQGDQILLEKARKFDADYNDVLTRIAAQEQQKQDQAYTPLIPTMGFGRAFSPATTPTATSPVCTTPIARSPVRQAQNGAPISQFFMP